MPKRVAVLQSNYIPWKGYFDIIHDVDEFIFYDDVQYTKNDWRNRNRIKTAAGPKWLTIPVGPRLSRLVSDVVLPDGDWPRSHLQRMTTAYATAPHFAEYRGWIEKTWLGGRWRTLSDWNQHLIRTIAQDLLGIRTVFRDSREFRLEGRGEDRLLDLLNRTGAEIYVSGPAAKAYIDPARFVAAGIELRWKDYSGYPDYPQLYPPFVHEVSVLDLMFHMGGGAPHFIWGWR